MQGLFVSAFPLTLTQRVSIQSVGTTRDEAGQSTEQWTEFKKAWASVKKTSGMEAIRAGAVTASVQASIRMRYRTDVDASMRIVHGTTIYKILAVLTDEERRNHTDFVCEVTGA